MIIAVESIQSRSEFVGKDKDVLQMMLDAIELLIRAYTNNNFQDRRIRFTTGSIGSKLYSTSPYIKKGDTIQISQSINDGLYVVKEVDDLYITLDKDLYDCSENLVTKIVYPGDIKKGVIDLMIWEQENRNKVGIKSESISRHSVTYYDQDANNQVMGYPVSLLGFLKPYKKARF